MRASIEALSLCPSSLPRSDVRPSSVLRLRRLASAVASPASLVAARKCDADHGSRKSPPPLLTLDAPSASPSASSSARAGHAPASPAFCSGRTATRWASGVEHGPACGPALATTPPPVPGWELGCLLRFHKTRITVSKPAMPMPTTAKTMIVVGWVLLSPVSLATALIDVTTALSLWTTRIGVKVELSGALLGSGVSLGAVVGSMDGRNEGSCRGAAEGRRLLRRGTGGTVGTAVGVQVRPGVTLAGQCSTCASGSDGSAPWTAPSSNSATIAFAAAWATTAGPARLTTVIRRISVSSSFLRLSAS